MPKPTKQVKKPIAVKLAEELKIKRKQIVLMEGVIDELTADAKCWHEVVRRCTSDGQLVYVEKIRKAALEQ